MAIQRRHSSEEGRGSERITDEMLKYPLVSWGHRLTQWRVPTPGLEWVPAVEVYEKADKFIVRAELPGMKKDEIDVSVVGDTLTISGERKAEFEVKDEDYCRCELCYGKFSRSVGLPAAVEAHKVVGEYENGILEVRLPKARQSIRESLEKLRKMQSYPHTWEALSPKTTKRLSKLSRQQFNELEEWALDSARKITKRP